ncbi:MAG: phosphoribosylamine--glycine ligase [Ruminococcaceae bacterium]|nr:phosphoribosylamine--glycine ligase [Oscillospiraceae bacterium]
MNILIIGGGGREHAIAQSLLKDSRVKKLWCAPGNGGIAEIAECLPYKATDIEGIVAFCKENHPDLVVVAPDDPLALGMVDALEAIGVRAFGPRKNAAVIEGSKAFAKDLMQKYNIPTAKYRVFDDLDAAKEYIKTEGAPIVIKADGLALGKGVTVAATVEEALAAAENALSGHVFGQAGDRVVIEECLTGPEVSVLCFTDGKTILPMVSAQDHKRAYDNDEGPNTGGMGVVSPNKYYTEAIGMRCMREIFRPTMEAMVAEGRPFKGVLYFGLMLTPNGPKVIEYNARFGDPETQAVLPRLQTSLLTIMEAIIDETLADVTICWSKEATACVVAASGGYPGKYPTGFAISGLEEAAKDAIVCHAGTKCVDGTLVTSGGRVLSVTVKGYNLDAALEKAYDSLKKISFDGMFFRSDIGRR